MKQTRFYPYELERRNYERLRPSEMSKEKLDKSAFVERLLSPAVAHADCGWYGVEYVAYTNGEEFVFFIDVSDHLNRGICVTADSKQAIATAVFDNID